MKKYNGLLSEIAQRYYVYKGDSETEDEWKTRLVYSVCGMMAYASLWDNMGTPVSIVHLKRKIRAILSSYITMYPELSRCFPLESEELESEITSLFLSTGMVYHCPNRIAPAMKHEEVCCDILFQRGIALDKISRVSGLGFYSKYEEINNPDSVKTMFGLNMDSLLRLWCRTIEAASWRNDSSLDYNTEYLRLNPPFSRGYWVDKPDSSGMASILRAGIKGSQLYYLYRFNGKTMEVSPLPEWQVELYNYRALACACLSSCGTLPPIEYSEDGALIHLRMNYLLPPRELEFLKLYSWPEVCSTLPCNFRRKLTKEVFIAVKSILSAEGYEFTIGGAI